MLYKSTEPKPGIYSSAPVNGFIGTEEQENRQHCHRSRADLSVRAHNNDGAKRMKEALIKSRRTSCRRIFLIFGFLRNP